MANKTMHHLVIEDNNYEIVDQKARQMVASEYDETATYHIGDLVVYDGKLLRCTTEIATPEAYNLNHWTYFTVKDALDNLEQGNVYASCDTAENDLNKTAIIYNYDRPNYAPKWFGIVAIRFVNAVKANSTLNINNTGAKPIYKGNAPITDGVIKAGDTALFMLNGSGRFMFLGSDTYGDKIDSLIEVSETQPQSENNKLWITESALHEYTIPTNEEFLELKADTTTLKEDLSNITEGGNLFDSSKAVDGYRISASGENYVDSTAFVSEYIPVVVGTTYTKNSPVEDAYHRFATYNAEKVNKRVLNDNTVTINDGESFVRFCGLMEEKETTEFYGSQFTAIDRTARNIAQKLNHIVGDYYYEIVSKIANYSIGVAVLYNVNFEAGDIIKLNYTLSNSGQGKGFTVVTFVNGANKDYFVNLSNTTDNGESEITITEDATQVKVYSTAGISNLIFSKKSSIDDLGNDLIKQVVVNKENIEQNEIDIVSIHDEIDYNSLGESMLMNNDTYNPHEFMKIVMLDNNYKFFSVANIKRIIDQMHTANLNYLELGFGGSGHGLSFKLNDMTFNVKGKSYDITNCVITNSGDYLSETDMEEIISYANQKGIEIIPALNVMSHMTALLTGRQEFWYNGSASTLDINNEEACDYAIGIAELYAKWFSERGVRFWNICVDEFYNYEYGYPYLQENGLYKYADFINRTAFALAKYRLSLLCWNDPICVNDSKVPYINRRLIVNYWAHKTGYGTLDKIVADGYSVVNSSDGIYWICNSSFSVTEAILLRPPTITRLARIISKIPVTMLGIPKAVFILTAIELI